MASILATRKLIDYFETHNGEATLEQIMGHFSDNRQYPVLPTLKRLLGTGALKEKSGFYFLAKNYKRRIASPRLTTENVMETICSMVPDVTPCTRQDLILAAKAKLRTDENKIYDAIWNLKVNGRLRFKKDLCIGLGEKGHG